MHGYTYSGHALACAAANANLDIVAAEDLPGNAARVGALLNEGLKQFMRYAHVGDVRGRGLMSAIELVADRTTKAPLMVGTPYVQTLVAEARAQGAIVRVQGNRLILSPPLVFTAADVDETVRILHAAFGHAERSVS
jgi:adenosylmethionine-8-amino-7-oxononanoate aminotransferase